MNEHLRCFFIQKSCLSVKLKQVTKVEAKQYLSRKTVATYQIHCASFTVCCAKQNCIFIERFFCYRLLFSSLLIFVRLLIYDYELDFIQSCIKRWLKGQAKNSHFIKQSFNTKCQQKHKRETQHLLHQKTPIYRQFFFFYFFLTIF